jgi:prepilin-type N-terminal cleavage/methylation domain-containing protein
MKRAFTLMELVVVMSMLAVLILVIAATLWGATQIERADAAVLHRVTVQAQLADQFRADVGRAVACPDTVRDAAADSGCLVLKMGDERHVVYRWAKERLIRREINGATETARQLSVGGEWIALQFVRPGPGGPLVTMRLIESRGAGTSQRTWPLDITAALGADLR